MGETLATGLIALLDDVAAIAKAAAASVDEVAAQTAKASVKAAGVVTDDTAVTPTYVVGLSPARELPIIGKIALGSLKNELIFLLPICLILGYFAPRLITPLLMIGGIYLCFEGAEKLYEAIVPHASGHAANPAAALDTAKLENDKVAGAIRTGFILSAEIMALTLAGVSALEIYSPAAVLAAVGILITAAVYGVVALIVKADDIGLYLTRSGGSFGRLIGTGLVKGVPVVLKVLATVGTAAMLWVGGSIIVHGLAEMGLHQPEHLIEGFAHFAEHTLLVFPRITSWLATCFLQAILGIVIGAITIILYATGKRFFLKRNASYRRHWRAAHSAQNERSWTMLSDLPDPSLYLPAGDGPLSPQSSPGLAEYDHATSCRGGHRKGARPVEPNELCDHDIFAALLLQPRMAGNLERHGDHESDQTAGDIDGREPIRRRRPKPCQKQRHQEARKARQDDW